MIYNIIVEDEAKCDLQNIYDYISKNDSSSKAKKFILELQKSIVSLDKMPFRCRDSYYISDKDCKDLIYKKYTIVFKIIDKTIHILTIFRQKSY